MPSHRSILSRLPLKKRMDDIGGKYSQEQASFPAGKAVGRADAPKRAVQADGQEEDRDEERDRDVLLPVALGHRDRA